MLDELNLQAQGKTTEAIANIGKATGIPAVGTDQSKATPLFNTDAEAASWTQGYFQPASPDSKHQPLRDTPQLRIPRNCEQQGRPEPQRQKTRVSPQPVSQLPPQQPPTPQRERWVRPPTYDNSRAPTLTHELDYPLWFEGWGKLNKDLAELKAREAEMQRLVQQGSRSTREGRMRRRQGRE